MIFSKEYLIDFLNNRYKKLKESQTDEDKKMLDYLVIASHGDPLTKEQRKEVNEYYYKKSKEERNDKDIKITERTPSEERLRLIFSLSNKNIIKEFEDRIVIQDKTNIKSLISNLKSLDEFENFCNNFGLAGRIYFEDFWGCENNPYKKDFYFRNNILAYIDMYYNENQIKIYILDILYKNEEVLQKDLKYILNFLDPDEIYRNIRGLETFKIITRTKYKNTYKIKLNNNV
nr:MAG TPA_asm: hypothetical protein [Caudoviricetes sp.]